MTYTHALNNYRTALIRAAILRAQGNRTQAAKALGMRRATLRYHIKALALVDLPPTHNKVRE